MPQQPFQLISRVEVTEFPPGHEASPSEFEPGDFILTHGNSVYSRLIRFGQAIRFHGPDRQYTWWSHAAMIVSKKGDLIEALNAGVIPTNLSKYKETEYYLVHLKDTLANHYDREQIVKFAEWCLNQRFSTGHFYKSF